MFIKNYGNEESVIYLLLDHKVNANILLRILYNVREPKLSLHSRAKTIQIIAKCNSSSNLANNKILMFQFPPLLSDAAYADAKIAATTCVISKTKQVATLCLPLSELENE